MNAYKLLSLFPLAYVVWWFYALFTWLIPSLSTPIVDIVNATWWSVISVVLFLTGGIILLFICLVLIFIIVSA